MGKLRGRVCAWVACGLLSSVAWAESEVLEVVYPRHLADQDVREANGFAIVSLALEQSGVAYELTLSDAPMSRRRMELELARSGLVDVVMLPDAAAYDDVYLKVDFSTDKGLLGQRVHLVNDQSLGKVAAVETLDDLKKLTGCTGAAWRITAQMEAQGFRLLKIENYEELFIYLSRNACDYISRGVMEILPEYEIFKKRYPNLSIDSHLLVQTPLRNVLYVSPDQTALRDALATGLANAVDNGEFDALIDRLYGQQLKALSLSERRVFTVENPADPLR